MAQLSFESEFRQATHSNTAESTLAVGNLKAEQKFPLLPQERRTVRHKRMSVNT